MDFSIRNYDAADEREVVTLWNRCLPRDEILLNTFRRKIILDPNFDARGCFVAIAGGSVIGFILSLKRRYPYYDLGLEEGKAWITVFFVDPARHRHGVADELFRYAEEYLRSIRVHEVTISDYTPNYFIPGVDVDAYASAYHLLRSRGYKKVQSVYGMGGRLVDLAIPNEIEEISKKLEQAGFCVTLFQPAHTLKVLEFLREFYPGDLFRVALDRLTENPESDDILVALKEGHVVGFSHFADERFGPFAIHPEYNGRGLGPLLYYHTVQQMRKKGKHNLWLAWTSGKAKDFYYKVGLKVQRRHVIMKKNL